MIAIFQKEYIQQTSAYIALILLLFIVLGFHIVPGLIAGLLSYVLTKNFLKAIEFKIPNNLTKVKIVGLIVGVTSFGVLSGLIFLTIKALNGENVSGLVNTLAETISNSKDLLPDAVAVYIPESVMEIKEVFISAIKSHMQEFANIGRGALHSFLLVLIGWLVGILIACKKPTKDKTLFSKTWDDLWFKLSNAFKFVVFAQIKVAAFNSFVMAIFLFIVAPIFDWNIPYAKMLILITFLCGLLPIIGNLISNTISFLLAFTVSIHAAIGALVVLMLIHKLEYLIISKSLGSDIDSDIWELLIILFSFEILFGVAGMVFSPIIYAFFKQEMRNFNWLPK